MQQRLRSGSLRVVSVLSLSLLVSACGGGEPCKHRGGARADFKYTLPIDTSKGTLCFANDNTLELGYWGGADTRLKQELSLRESFVGAGYKEGDTKQEKESRTLTFYKDQRAVNVFLMPTHSTRPSPFRKATMMQFYVQSFK